jgi:hypothetical protein
MYRPRAKFHHWISHALKGQVNDKANAMAVQVNSASFAGKIFET